ncbi:hypothetical protein [Putridiphycobacter roseus]|uniref:hypothetical protein n=1 Tax=Putridiphycobacter roseus TaxID=2219161 RepID=UPI00362B2EBC
MGNEDRDRVLMTDRREKLLIEGYNPSNNAERAAMSRLKNSSETALWELTKIAESPEVDHTDVFDPDQVFRFLRALLNPNLNEDHIDTDSPLLAEPGGGAVTEDDYSDEFRAYSDRLQMQMTKLILDEPDE